MKRFLIVIEKARKNYSAYSPDLPGCVATGKTRRQAVSRMDQALRLHIQGLVEMGERVPEPRASASFVAVSSTRR